MTMTDASTLPIADASRLPTVLQIVPALAGGGIARAAVDTAAALVASGARAVIASPPGPMLGELRRLKVAHIALPPDRDSLLQALGNVRRLRRSIADHGVDIVHSRSRAAAWTARQLARSSNLVFVASAHWPDRGERWSARRMEAAQAQADAVIAVSDFVAQSATANRHAGTGRVVTIPSGINLDHFNPATVRAERLIKLAAQWRLPDDRRIILFPARLDGDRGQTRLIDAIKHLGRRDIYCLLLGALATPTAFEGDLKRYIEARDLGGIVGITAFCDDMPAAYMLSDVVVVGGQGQGFSRASIEAQAMSRPVVCDADSGAVEGIVPGETGWAAPAGAPAALAQALDHALRLTADERASLSHRAQRHVRTLFSVDTMCRRTLALYAELMGRAV
ncbi:glycosyltransferase family 4 protein [Vineibacter terrae]|uniref:Glycosyltransferase family 4 protein n=1 Tax=Vineibacter terrae TaxID=2586908 RepID=A0A5C8PKR5_9HYPH|nr:glycosyltransferase [Vineibacter terrae]TXL73991.1 glycosyltransferase family 4 protein [Vineibacter terrae]